MFRVTKQDNSLGTGSSCRFTIITNIDVMFVRRMYSDEHQHLNTHRVPTHTGRTNTLPNLSHLCVKLGYDKKNIFTLTHTRHVHITTKLAQDL